MKHGRELFRNFIAKIEDTTRNRTIACAFAGAQALCKKTICNHSVCIIDNGTIICSALDSAARVVDNIDI